MNYKKPSLFHYRIAQAVCCLVSMLIFRCRTLRNEIKGIKGPFVVIANHQCALDFVNLIGKTSQPMNFVISRSFYSTLPIKGYLQKMGVIPKQQFQTTVSDMKRMKSVIDNDGRLVIYPAGLMCEDGLSTPIPTATYKFLKWLKVDVYVARSYGSYFVMPKWTGGIRPGRTYIDIYKLLSKEELEEISIDELRRRTDDALLFDAYREQEDMMVKYANSTNLSGIENVLYICPNCGAEHTMTVENDSRLRCTACGYAQTADEYGFLHNAGPGEEIRYISNWSRRIYAQEKQFLRDHPEFSLSSRVRIRMVDEKKNKFMDAGEGILTLSSEGFHLLGTIHDTEVDLNIPTCAIPALPFSPGKHLEIQDGSAIYRCLPEDGRLVMKFINMIKINYALRSENPEKSAEKV